MSVDSAVSLAESSLSRPPRRQFGPFSRRVLAATLNGRSTEGKFVWSYQRELIQHIGGGPSIVQRRLIERASMLALHLWKCDQQACRDGGLSPRGLREYLAMNGALTKTLVKLGLQSTAAARSEQPRAARRKAAEGQEGDSPANALPDPIDALVAALEAGSEAT